MRFTFPVTGGRVTLSPLGGTIDHRGGILFLNVKNGKKIEVSRFTIDLTHADLTGIVNGNPQARVPLFRLDLSHARLAAGKHIVTARGIGLTLTAAAAKALNAALGTKLFSAGLKLGPRRVTEADSGRRSHARGSSRRALRTPGGRWRRRRWLARGIWPAAGASARCRGRASSPSTARSSGPPGRGDRHGLTRSWRRQGGTAWLLLGHLSAGAGMTEQQPHEAVDRPDGFELRRTWRGSSTAPAARAARSR